MHLRAAIIACSVIFSAGSGFEIEPVPISILASVLELTEDEGSTKSSEGALSKESISPASPFRVDDSFFDMAAVVMDSRQALLRQFSFIGERIDELPAMLEKLLKKSVSIEETLRSFVDCDGVRLPETVDESIKQLFDTPHVNPEEFLKLLPTPIACFLIQRRVDKAKYKHHSLQKVGERLVAARNLISEVVGEIDSAFAGHNTQHDVKAFWFANFGPFIDSRGRWLQAIRENHMHRDRLERIRAEFVTLRSEGMGYNFGTPSKTPSHAERVFADELLRIMNLHFEEGRDILMGTQDSLIRRLVSQIGSHIHNLTICNIFKDALAELSKKLSEYGNAEQTLQFEALGIDPLRSYNKKNIPVGYVDAAIEAMNIHP